MAVNPEKVNVRAFSIVLGDQIEIGGAIYEVVDRRWTAFDELVFRLRLHDRIEGRESLKDVDAVLVLPETTSVVIGTK